MHRATLASLSLCIAGCSAQLQELPPVSIKDSPARLIAAVARADTIRVLVHGGEGLTKVDLDLAMAQALRRRGFTIVTDGQAWTVTANVTPTHIDWSLTDSAGTPHASIRQDVPRPGEIRGTDAVAAASAAASSVAKFIPSPKGEKL